MLALTDGLAVWLYGRWGTFLRGASGEWRSNRWRIGGTSFMLVLAVFALGPAVPVSGDVRLAVQLLVLGVGMMFGVASVADQPGLGTDAENADCRETESS